MMPHNEIGWTPGDQLSGTWRKLYEHLAKRRTALLVKLTMNLPYDETQFVRGRLQELDELLTLESNATTQMRRVP